MRTLPIGVLAVAGVLASIGDAKGQANPTITVEIAEAELRSRMPADGELVAQGEISKDYVGLALGRRVRAQGKRVFVSDERVGPQGVVFRDGYIELNCGAHLEKEVQVAFLKPTLAVDASFTAHVWFDDRLGVAMNLIWHELEGDNLGGKIAVEVAHGRLAEAVEKQTSKIAEEISRKIRSKIPAGADMHVVIRPGTLTVVQGPRPAGAPQAPARRQYLCHESDACGRENLTVQGVGGPVTVHKGETKEVRIRLDGDGFFFWFCDDSRERTRPVNRETTLVVVHRAASGRHIDWYCYKELPPGS